MKKIVKTALMRQHPIPQNILDIEFKLFTKFTLKEFAYLAIGLGFGGLMIYLTVKGIIPGILGVPIFILSSGSGIFLALVPINDQDADLFLKNYVTAITSPTQRVWMNKKIRDERAKPLIKPTKEGTLVHKETPEKPKIIGATQIPEPTEKQEEQVKQPVTATPASFLQINSENISAYQFSIKTLDSLPGNINIWLCTKNMTPIPNVIAYLRDKKGKVLYANKTGPNGYFLTNKMWDPGIYTLEFQHPQYQFPKVQLILVDKNVKLPIKINNI